MHGSARWANEKDIKGASLLDNDGVYVGGWLDWKNRLRYLRHDGPEHVLVLCADKKRKRRWLSCPNASLLAT